MLTKEALIYSIIGGGGGGGFNPFASSQTQVLGPNGYEWVNSSDVTVIYQAPVNYGPSAGLIGNPGSVVENQYGRWEYTKEGVWKQTVDIGHEVRIFL